MAFGLPITMGWPYFPQKLEFRTNIEKKVRALMSEMEMEWKKFRGEPRTASGVRKLWCSEPNSCDQ